MNRILVLVAALVLLFLLSPEVAQAQSGLPAPGSMASQNLRGYTHMFIAYFLAWALILGWVISIARRLGLSLIHI